MDHPEIILRFLKIFSIRVLTNVKYLITIYIKTNDRLKKYLQSHLNIPNLNLIFPEDISKENLLSYAPEADIIVGWRVDDDIKLNATRMKLYINPGAGIKHHIEFFRII